ncbi:hypothetical protein [Actinomadura atramentaria]|uniref:hypothetical protein n=1 Tax=Actinomadura atramentaria TaxID=1990 RepID=UPI000362D5B3|nr:hypothetical protein [Actinomadura atramentaria]
MTIKIDPERIAKHGQDVQQILAGPFTEARNELNANGTVEGGDFSVTGTACGVAYPMGLQFAFEDLNTHRDMLENFKKGIDNTAKTYRASEQSSTIQTV